MPILWAISAQNRPGSAEFTPQWGCGAGTHAQVYNKFFTSGSDGGKLTDVSESRLAHLQVTVLASSRRPYALTGMQSRRAVCHSPRDEEEMQYTFIA